jgi:hypothetical protein
VAFDLLSCLTYSLAHIGGIGPAHLIWCNGHESAAYPYPISRRGLRGLTAFVTRSLDAKRADCKDALERGEASG